jgi:hypothetical protein
MGKPVRNLKTLVKTVEQCKEEYLKIELNESLLHRSQHKGSQKVDQGDFGHALHLVSEKC